MFKPCHRDPPVCCVKAARFLTFTSCSETGDGLSMQGTLVMDRGPVHLVNTSAKTERRKACRRMANTGEHDRKPVPLTDTVTASRAAMRRNETRLYGTVRDAAPLSPQPQGA